MDLENVNVFSPDDSISMLEHEGIGHAVVVNGQITQIRCGIFAVHKSVPVRGQKYVISGKLVDGEKKVDFKVTLPCHTSGRPQSIFQ